MKPAPHPVNYPLVIRPGETRATCKCHWMEPLVDGKLEAS